MQKQTVQRRHSKRMIIDKSEDRMRKQGIPGKV